MKHLFFIFSGMLALAACNSAGSSDAGTDSASADSTATAATAEAGGGDKSLCYLHVEGKDTTTVNVTIHADNTVTGTYDWAPWQKDGAHGTLDGRKQGDMVTVTYDYTIEGANQKEEKLFKMTGDLMAEASGELEDSGDGVMKIKQGTKLSWRPLSKVDCK